MYKEIVEKMSLREKIQQTVVVLMEKGKKIEFSPGAAFFFGQIITEADETGISELRGYVKELYDSCEIPPLITSDFENGCGSMVKGLTPLPYMMSLGATDDENLAYDYGKATALEARTVGANWTFSPVCDLNMNFRNPLVNNRSLTDNPELACKMLPNVIRGMQDGGIAACAKHFPGDGVDYRDQHLTTTANSLSLEDWKNSFGKVYKKLFANGVMSVMAGHIAFPAYPQKLSEKFSMPLPATLNKALITDLLKGELGFKGIVVTDALDMGGYAGWYDTREQSEIESFKAGCDMMLWPSETYVDNLERAIKNGEVSEERLNDAVTRILGVKERLGLLSDNYNPFYDLTETDKAFVKTTQSKCAEKCITLICDKEKHFPIDAKKVRKIGINVITEHPPVKEEALALKREFEKRGFEVNYTDTGFYDNENLYRFYAENDLIIYAFFSRPFRPMGFIDFISGRAVQIKNAFCPPNAMEKTAFVSFGSPYIGKQYFQRAGTYVNAYSMLECEAVAFVKAACGEIEFSGKSPVKIK